MVSAAEYHAARAYLRECESRREEYKAQADMIVRHAPHLAREVAEEMRLADALVADAIQRYTALKFAASRAGTVVEGVVKELD